MTKTVKVVGGIRVEIEADKVRCISETTAKEFTFKGAAARAWLAAYGAAMAEGWEADFVRESLAGFGVVIQ
ncbi:hypothetical protein EXN61_21915 [Agrobacterium tumefaciens]|uniref:Uncharacterized protein n=1 Tax=Agrobacterium tumefaciens TaxID=358 RepID=A0A546XRZ3_AGRTU|nr:hypothetical protein [Agrobacterium tumefaciens]TRB03515.1 hypothetical protein EXN61_21915 [Agrobacterium tumefaciens]